MSFESKIIKRFPPEKWIKKRMVKRRRTFVYGLIFFIIIVFGRTVNLLSFELEWGGYGDGDDDIMVKTQNSVEGDTWWLSTEVEVWNSLSEDQRDEGYRAIVDGAYIEWAFAPKGMSWVYDRGIYDSDHECKVARHWLSFVADTDELSNHYNTYTDLYNDWFKNSPTNNPDLFDWFRERGIFPYTRASRDYQEVSDIQGNENNYFPVGASSAKSYRIRLNSGSLMMAYPHNTIFEQMIEYGDVWDHQFYLSVQPDTYLKFADEKYTYYALHRWFGVFDIEDVFRSEYNTFAGFKFSFVSAETDVVLLALGDESSESDGIWGVINWVGDIVTGSLNFIFKTLPEWFIWILARSADFVMEGLEIFGDLLNIIVDTANIISKPLKIFGIDLNFRTPKQLMDINGWISTFGAGAFISIIVLIGIVFGPALASILVAVIEVSSYLIVSVIKSFGYIVGGYIQRIGKSIGKG